MSYEITHTTGDNTNTTIGGLMPSNIDSIVSDKNLQEAVGWATPMETESGWTVTRRTENDKIEVEVATNKTEAITAITKLRYNILPANSDKVAVVKWKCYQTQRITSDDASEWLEKFSGCNWVVMTGSKPYSKSPGLICVDGDDAEAVELIKKHLPHTPLTTSTQRGSHFFYRRPDTEDRIKSHTHSLIDGKVVKIDVKADGSYCVMPGSVHSKGHVYSWSEPWTKELIESLPVFDPTWLPKANGEIGREDTDCNIDEPEDHKAAIEELDVSYEDRFSQAAEYLCETDGAVQGKGDAGADGYVLAIAGTILWEYALAVDQACEALYEWGQRDDQLDDAGGVYHWSWNEIRHKVNDASKSNRKGLTVGKRLDPHRVSPEAYEELTKVVTEIEPETLKPTLKEDERFAYLFKGFHSKITNKDRAKRMKAISKVWEMIPDHGLIPEYIRYYLPTSDCPVKFLLASVLSLSGHLMNRKVWMPTGDGRVNPSIWAAVLAESSTLHKSTAIKTQRKWITNDEDYMDTLLPDSFTMEALIKKLGWELTSDKGEDGEDNPNNTKSLIQQTRAKCQQMEGEPGEYTKGVGLFHVDELGGWLAGLERSYNQGGKATITEWYDKDDDYIRETKGSGAYYIYKPRISILAASTVQWLTANCSQSDLLGGFLPRWLFFYERNKDYVLSMRDAPDITLLETIQQRISMIKSHRGEIRLSQDAMDFYWDWRREIEEGAEPIVKAWVNRLGDNAFKIAMIYEATTSDVLEEVSEQNMRLACKLIDAIKADVVDLLTNELAWTEDGKDLQIIKRHIRDAGVIAHSLLLRKSAMKAKVMAGHIETLEQQDVIEVITTTGVNNRTKKSYKWTMAK